MYQPDTTLDRSRRVDKALLTLLFVAGLAVCGLGQTTHQPVVIAGGLLLSFSAALSVALPERRTLPYYPIAISSLLAAGFLLRIVEFTNPVINYDEWVYMSGVGRDLASYLKMHRADGSEKIMIHYWLTRRVLGGTLLHYRAVSGVVGVLFLPLVFLGLRRFWPRTTCLVALSLLAFSGTALQVTWYSMIPYGFNLLVSGLLFLLFMRLAEGPIRKERWPFVAACIVLSPPFTQVTTAIPVVIGVLAVVLFRCWRPCGQPQRCDSKLLARDLLPFLAFPLYYAAGWLLLSGGPRTPSVYHHLFPTSGFRPDLLGAAAFLVQNTGDLISGTVGTVGRLSKATGVLLAFSIVSAIWQSFRAGGDRRVAFTLVFIAGCAASIAGGGLLGLYPYGPVRYTPYLIVPTSVILGYGGTLIWRWVSRRWSWRRSRRALVLFMVSIPILVGGYIALGQHRAFTSQRLANQRMIAWIQDQHPDLILKDGLITPFLEEVTPEIAKHSLSMGWGVYSGDSLVPSHMVDVLTAPEAPTLVLVIVGDKPLGRWYPAWDALLRDSYFVIDSLESPDIDAALFRRKAGN